MRSTRAAALGAGVGLAALLVVFLLETVALSGRLGPGRLAFLRRIADIDPAHIEAIAGQLFGAAAAIYTLAAGWCAGGLALSNVVWVKLGARSLRRLLMLDAAALGWLLVAGQLRLMAVHPYAREDAAWRAVEPLLRSWWTPALALALTIAGALVVGVVVAGRSPRRVALAALPLVTFWPLLGPGSLERSADGSVVTVPAPPDAPPAVVIIGVDSLRPDFVTALGGPPGLTPRLDAFLADAYVFSEARVPIGRTHPSWISLLTALTPDHHGVRYNRPDPWFAERLPTTLAGQLRSSGWRTRFLTDDDLFSTLSPIHGFDRVEQPPSVLRTYAVDQLMGYGLLTLLPARWTRHLVPDLHANRALHQNYDARDFTRRIIAAVDAEQASGDPFLLCAHLCVLHYPGTQPGPGFRAHQAGDDPTLGYFKVALGRLGREDPRTTTPRATRVTGLYAAGVANADREVGHLLDHLRRTGVYDRAWVVLWSDHGESFNDSAGHPVRPNHGVYVDNGDQDLRVVLALKPPRGQGPRGRSSHLVRSIDVAPTLLEGLGQPPLEGPRDGVSLTPLMEGRPLPELEHYAETGLKWGRTQTPGEPPYSFAVLQSFRALDDGADLVTRRRFHGEIVLGKHRALRLGRWKVAYHPTRARGVWNLWDMTRAERGDQRTRHPAVFARLAARMRAHMADLAPERLREASGGDYAPLTPPWWPWARPPPRVAEPATP